MEKKSQGKKGGRQDAGIFSRSSPRLAVSQKSTPRPILSALSLSLSPGESGIQRRATYETPSLPLFFLPLPHVVRASGSLTTFITFYRHPLQEPLLPARARARALIFFNSLRIEQRRVAPLAGDTVLSS